MPTPSAGNFNDGESPASWAARKAELDARLGNSLGLPLGVAVQLLKTPTAQLADNGGSQPEAKRRAGGHGPTLADQVEHDPALLPSAAAGVGNSAATSGSSGPVRLLPTPLTGEARHGSPHQHRSAGDTMLTGVVLGLGPDAPAVSPGRAARLLPTPDATHGRKSTRTGPLLPDVAALFPTPAAADGDRASKTYPRGNATLAGAVMLPTPSSADGLGGHLSRGGDRAGEELLGGVVKRLLPTPTQMDGHGSRNSTQPRRPGSTFRPGDTLTDAIMVQTGVLTRADDPLPLPEARADVAAWGEYEPAIRRWEAVTNRPAPAPTEPGRTGPRLAPRFVEWMMGLPAGHVTNVPKLSRSAQLRGLGNGVVPLQAAHAIAALAAVARHVREGNT